jgi:ComF family protein
MHLKFPMAPLSRPPHRWPAARRMVLLSLLWLEDWIVPPVCSHCGSRRLAAMPLCRACLRLLRDARPEEDEVVTGMPWIRALFRLTPPLHALIHGFKYRHQRRHIRFLVAWLRWRRAWRDDLGPSYDGIIPVPLHPARRRERGYNQAALLAREIGAAGDVPAREDLLRRVRYTGTQTQLGGRRRGRNLEDAFRVPDAGKSVQGMRLLLVDDVCTTGSTLAHCREELLRAGAARVDALVVAWVERRKDEPPLPDFADFETAAGFFA